MGKILVLGATGAVGGQLVQELLQRGQSVRAATRRPAEAAAQLGAAVECVRFDLEQPETFAAAVEGVDRVFLLARPGDDEPQRTACPLIDVLKLRGVRHVVALTAMGTELRPDFGLRRVECHLEASGIAWTHLRPNWFMQVFAGGPMLADLRSSGALHLPAGDAKISYIDVRDIAAVAAVALSEPGHTGRGYTLTGPEALEHSEITRQISLAAGRTFAYVPIGEEAAGGSLAAAGLPPARIERLLGFYRLVRQGYCAPVSPDVATVLGRPAISFAQFAQDHAACWAAAKPT